MTTRAPAVNGPTLIVNADDFGFFDGVSRGILEAAGVGAVTATGVMANGPALDRWIGELRDVHELDTGVHLNATLGQPMTAVLGRYLQRWGGQLPGKFALAGAVVRRLIPVEALKIEWHAQIERCLSAGLRVHFLNSHEHVHALPVLWAATCELAEEFRVPHVRRVAPEWDIRAGLAGMVRSGLLATLARPRVKRHATPTLLGLAASGRLDLPYLLRVLSRLRPGEAYELMCHPGRLDAEALAHDRLRRYHDWEGELRLLTGPEFGSALRRLAVRLVGFRDLR